MLIRCERPVITDDGVHQLVFYFNTETLEFEFDEKDHGLLIKLYNQQAIDVPEQSDYTLDNF